MIFRSELDDMNKELGIEKINSLYIEILIDGSYLNCGG